MVFNGATVREVRDYIGKRDGRALPARDVESRERPAPERPDKADKGGTLIPNPDPSSAFSSVDPGALDRKPD